MSLALVQYGSDSDSESGHAPSPKPPLKSSAAIHGDALKRKRSVSSQTTTKLPPLPAAFHDLYSTNARASTSDDPSLHRGRRRAVPHVQGNWPTHVYLEWLPSQPETESLNNLINHVCTAIADTNGRLDKPLPIPEIHPSLLSDLGTPVPLHVSLSRTLQIKTDDRDEFHHTLTSSLRRAAVRPFNVRFTGLKWVSNYERNRWFLVLGIEKPARDELNRLLSACNDAAEQCGHPPLYVGGKGDGPMETNSASDISSNKKMMMKMMMNNNNSNRESGKQTESSIDRTQNYHVSIAWNLEEPSPEWITLVQSVDVSNFISSSPQAPFESVKAKIGNTINNIELDSRKANIGRKSGLLGLG